VEEEKQEDQN